MDALFEGTDTSFRGSDSSIGTLAAKQGKTERISRGRQTVDTETETRRDHAPFVLCAIFSRVLHDIGILKHQSVEDML
ncbi:hypothetical protein PHLCEN_2v4239 [Hermanssonia centrifuga]|uniref:Uncharacterized protein n=1 Tax=Hermanssonia centrifuga TaxID=98765 RepID=A0A2R6PYT5_9APHY|nr:hypothetical protein PHLCEN_2v4239 [Hermanssonia centrifuga]